MAGKLSWEGYIKLTLVFISGTKRKVFYCTPATLTQIQNLEGTRKLWIKGIYSKKGIEVVLNWSNVNFVEYELVEEQQSAGKSV